MGRARGAWNAQAAFDQRTRRFPPSRSFWRVEVGDPGRTHLFDPPVYQRGAMTLHALRVRIGDAAFFRLLKAWVSANAAAR